MNISSVIDIIDGKLQNSPSVSFIYNIKTDAKKVMEGDLFLAKNIKDTQLAIKNGAFAVVHDFEIEILDNEIAWIRVNSLEETLIKLFRFKFSTFNLEVYYCDKVTFDLINIYKASNKKIRIIFSKLETCVKIIENINEDEIFICSNEELIKSIYPNYKPFSKQTYKINNLIEHSLFETSFSYKEIFFHKLKLSSLYINQFLDVYNFFNLELDLQKLMKLNHFKPIFVDKYLNIIDFGRSNKVIICQKNLELILEEIKYLEEKYKYGKTIFITPLFIENFNQQQIVLEDIGNLKKVLKNEYFNALYIIGYDKLKIEETLKLSSNETSELF
ncbi:MAG: peptidoglycan synthetase [Arcobacter sp.]|uniref:peptidoglycan synthetase n=1 Tax=uncultured Arcobacter sp. TaxID=165434 RepID=UPI000CAD1C1D|nr:peptidoglycan synthetase [uncultured Arcobacter sp.]PLY11411.1 MAG: peptidoglycan synthetase [Arcobacter sp.]